MAHPIIGFRIFRRSRFSEISGLLSKYGPKFLWKSGLEIEQHAAQLIFGPQTMQMSDEIEKSQSAATKQT
ncbi:uncharacterized protein H6S33_009745 [Morchella sextelata]|jgi:hypothetical protein|uniref:uncharacterized protein n=1 Tax=Morchella sextelata TaxID=1174677 RepID=UPI001D04C0D2|nr:uncharacterized protein H6S33_009745 [Morchella sextelata]KAH0613365.1 hypothetical protein H6S33_009745 [Morchella sextelata]